MGERKERDIHRDPERKDTTNPILSVQEVESSHPNKWILMKVTQFDENRRPLRGEVLAKCATRKAISKELVKQLPLTHKPPEHPFYIFKAQHLYGSGGDLRTAIIQAAEQEK